MRIPGSAVPTMHLVMQCLAAILLLGKCQSGFAEKALIAVASNFTGTAHALEAGFERNSGHDIEFSFGSTGQLFTQIYQGAPFDAFLAADNEHPQRAVTEGLAVAESLLPYARGRLALFGTGDYVNADQQMLENGHFRRLALANPVTAPYGRAASEVLQALGLQPEVEKYLVRGNNIAQTFQFVVTGNAYLGFVALTQVRDRTPSDYWLIPETLHAPIEQSAVMLTHGENNEAARAFLAFLTTEEALGIISEHGYAIPGAPIDD